MQIFELVGKMAIDGMDKSKQQLGDLEKKTQQVQKGLRVMGAAFTAVGAAGLAIVASTKAINAQLSVTAHSLGISTKEMRDLTLATTNVTFPIDEVTASFDLLARAGVKDQKVLADTATAFDTLGDALGLGASQVTEVMVPAMKTFRLSAEEIASKTDIMTYMVRNSTTSLEDFNTMVGYTDQEMVEAGLTIEDMAAAMMYMSDSGVEPGKVMLREWNKAVTRSKEEGIALTEALGMTSAELETYKGKLEGATGLTEELADLQNEQYTIMDKVKHKFSELALGASGFLEPLEPILAGMTALGPLMIALSTSAGTAAIKWALHTVALVAHKIALLASAIAIKAVTAAQWLWNAAMTANPIGLIIAGIALLVGAGIALWKNWDKVTAFFEEAWASLKIAVLTGVEKILEGLSKFMDWIPKLGDKIQEAHDAISNMIDEEKVTQAARRVGDALEEVGEAAAYIIPVLEDVARTAELTTDDMLRNIRDLTDEAKDSARERTRAETDAINDRMRAAQDAHQETMSRLSDEYNATIAIIDARLSQELAGYQSQIEAIDNQMRAIGDAQRMRQDAERKAELEAEIAQEGDAGRRVDLEERLNELILRSGNEEWQAERKIQLKAKIAEEKDAEARKKLEEGLAKFLIEVQAQRNKEQLADEKSALLKRIDMAREQATNAKNQAQEQYDYQRRLVEQAHKDLINTLEDEKEALDAALEEKLERYDDDLEAFQALLDQELVDVETFVAAYNAEMDKLQDKTVTITTVQQTIAKGKAPPPVPGAPSGAYYSPETGAGVGYLGYAGWYDFQRGGIAMEPMIARIGEQAPRIPEAVIPLDRLERMGLGGYRTLNLTIELDGRAITRVVEARMVEDIRFHTGIKR